MSALRPVQPAELPALLRLNNRFAEAVNALAAPDFAALVEGALLAIAAWDMAEPARPRGFLIALGPEGPERGPNHGWMRAHHPGAAYVDRVVVDSTAQGQGLGRALYAALAARALEAGLPLLGCEVNLQPPNPASLRFHERLGFQAVGEATDPRNGKHVRYLTAPAAPFFRSTAKPPLSGGLRLNTSLSQPSGPDGTSLSA